MRKLFLFCMLVVATVAAQAKTMYYNRCTYEVISESPMTCRLKNADNVKNGVKVVIPDSVQSYAVTSIGPDAFSKGTLVEVELPDCVTEIGNFAFFRCENLKSVKFPSSLESIGTSAFIGCRSLTSVDIPSTKLSKIDVGAFAECLSLMEINIPEENRNISSSGGVVVKQGTVICAAGGRSEFTIPGWVSEIGNNAFSVCSKMTEITLPSSLNFIGNNAFYGCSNLDDVELPASLKEIGTSAFSGCTSLSHIEIPASVTKIGAGAFGSCHSLMAINVDPDNTVFSSVNGLLLNKSEFVLNGVPGGLKTVKIPESVRYINGGAFRGCDKLESIDIPETIEEIWTYAFEGCSNLKVVVLHEGIQAVYGYTFNKCSSLQAVVLPSSVKSIENFAFGNCVSLKSIDIPAGDIKAFAFQGCTNLQYILLGDSVTSIGMKSFEECDKIETIVSYNTQAPSLSPSSFDEEVFANAKLRVRPECIETYSEANNWSKFDIGAIKDDLVTAIVLDRQNYSSYPGDAFRINADVYTEEAQDKRLNWYSSDSDVATVENTGDVNVHQGGECDIVAEAADGSGVRSICRVKALATGVENISIGENDLTDVYALAGKLLFIGIERKMVNELPAGVYILKSGDKAEKAIVK